MVKVINYETRKNNMGESFNVLIVQGGLMPVVSKETGKTYLTVKKATVPCTFDSETCSELIDETLDGKIEKVPCEAYSYTIKETGETVMLDYRYEYIDRELQIREEHMVDKEMVS